MATNVDSEHPNGAPLADETHIPAEDEAPIALADSGETSEGGKLKMIVQLVKRCLGVKDIAAMRLSLPASLLEPIPNLEYWQYLDRPDLFAAINDSDDAFERMLAVIRFTFSKDLKFIRGKVCKPYNSVLGEHFRSHWDVIPVTYPSNPLEAPIHHQYLTESTRPAPRRISESSTSIKSSKSARGPGLSAPSLRSLGTRSSKTLPNVNETLIESNAGAAASELSLAITGTSDEGAVVEGAGPEDAERVRVIYMTEQVSHHPPISSFHIACPARGVEGGGVDQISAKVSGTAIRVSPGPFNKGIFVRITEGEAKGETYQVTHPAAYVNGVLRGSFYVTVSDCTIITCEGGQPGEKLRTIIEYKEESWLGKAHFALEGVIHVVEPGETAHEEWTRVKHVPKDRVVAIFDGSWRGVVRWKRTTSPNADYATLIDLGQLLVIPKQVRPLAKQLPTESRRLWENVTTRLLAKEYGDATKYKHEIEQRQRDIAGERKRKGEEFVPVFFEKDIESGFPVITAAGRAVVEEEMKEIGEITPPNSFT